METCAAFLNAAVAATVLIALTLPAEAGADEKTSAEARLDRLVDKAIAEGGPFFTPNERQVIERACGYAPGTWDGFQVDMVESVFVCTNGRRVSSPQVRAVMAAASPRIDAHVDAVMDRPEIVAAMEQVEREAEAKQLPRNE